jgi:hypothetical protein
MKPGIKKQFESAISKLTNPLNGQYPRPWMTDLKNPQVASVFIVGKNQAKGFPTERITHERHVDALFNRNGQSCRGLYLELTEPSPTRCNIDSFASMLADVGVYQVLETNVVCYSTPMSQDLSLPEHRNGENRGTEMFCTLLHYIKPRVLIAHGAGTIKKLSKVLDASLPSARKQPGPPVRVEIGEKIIFIIPSLAPPAWNKWSSWSREHLAEVSKGVADAL